jgi:hypothetical protein
MSHVVIIYLIMVAQNNEIKDGKYNSVDGEETYHRSRVEVSVRTSKANE